MAHRGELMLEFVRRAVEIVLPYIQSAPGYGRAAWEAAVYLYEPRTAAIAGAAVLILILLRVFLGGVIGWLLRSLAYGGLFLFLSTYEDFVLLFPDPVSARIVAAVAIVVLWFGVTVIGGGLRLLRARPPRAAAMVAAGSPPEGAAREAFDVKRPDQEQKQQICIMMTDIQGYSARMEKDEAATWEILKEHNIIMRKAITTHRGKEIKTIGDAFMVVFQNPIDAVKCGIAMQKGLREFNRPRPVNDQLKVRIGIHRGEVIVTGKDVFGEGVNIAARLESITDPGGISISADVYQHVKNKVEAGFQSVGTPKLKNIANPPEVFKLQLTQN